MPRIKEVQERILDSIKILQATHPQLRLLAAMLRVDKVEAIIFIILFVKSYYYFVLNFF